MKSTCRTFLASAALASLLATTALRGSGQEDALGKPLHLDGRPVTLKELIGAVQTQSGMVVKFPSSLSGRRLAVASTGQSVKAVLNAICEAEGWSWHAADDGATVIEGPSPQVKRGESLYAAVRRMTPPDLATFCNMPAPDKLQAGGGAPGSLDRRRTAVSSPLTSALSKMDEKLTGEGVKLSELKSGKDELVLLGIITSFGAQRAVAELYANSDFLLARPEATKLHLEKGTILMIECDLGPGRQPISFGANTATKP